MALEGLSTDDEMKSRFIIQFVAPASRLRVAANAPRPTHQNSVPKGRAENSPAFQRWVMCPNKSTSPEGTKERGNFRASISVVPSGLVFAMGLIPSVETLGYFRWSLRDNQVNSMLVFNFDAFASANAPLRAGRMPAPDRKSVV